MRQHRVWRRAGSMRATPLIAVLIALLAVAVLVAPLAGEAPQAPGLPRIGFLPWIFSRGGCDNGPASPFAEFTRKDSRDRWYIVIG